VSELLPIVTGILALGILAQVLASRFEVPSVLFLILIGVGLGPEGLDVVTLETFGDGLSTVVGVSVAIILFDGGLHLSRDQLNEAPSAIFRLVTVGAAVMLVGTSLAVYLFLNADPTIALLIGSLLVATGPTVVTPILEVVTVRENVGAAMEAEGIINDVTAAVLAIVVFEALVVEYAPGTALIGFLQRLTVGVGIGLIVAAGVWLTLTRTDPPANDAPQLARLVALAGAVVAFGMADSVFPETGVAAAATAGVALANVDLPHRDAIQGFSRDLTLIVLAFVFISLAALIDFGALLGLGIAGVAVVAVVTLVVRPLLVFVSVRDPQFTRGERLFLSAVAPRGIIPASVATLFAIELESAGEFAAAQTLAGTVFLVIFITVVLQGGFARQIAERLEVIPMPTLIVGGGRVGRALAHRLENRGENVVVVEDDPEAVESLQLDGFSVVEGDGTDADTLREAGIERAKTVVAATGSDNTNLLVSQLAGSTFEVADAVSRVNQPDNLDAFETLDVRAIDAATATAWTLDNEIERPALSHWMNEIGEGHDVQEIEVTATDLVGRTIGTLDREMPDGCIVAVLARGDDTFVPDGDTKLEAGDRITLLGNTDAVAEAISWCHPHD